jgi:hypothetical protein
VTFSRLAGAAGLGGVALWIMAFSAFPSPPGLGASPQEVIDFATNNRGYLLASIYVIDVLPALAFLVLGVGIWEQVRRERAWATLGLLGSAMLSLGVLSWVIPDALLAAQAAREADPSTIAVIFDQYHAIHVFAHASIAVLIGAYTAAGHRTGLMPRWARWLGGFAAASALVVIPAGYIKNAPLEAVHLLSIAAFAAWVMVASLRLLRWDVAAAPAHARETVLAS